MAQEVPSQSLICGVISLVGPAGTGKTSLARGHWRRAG